MILESSGIYIRRLGKRGYVCCCAWIVEARVSLVTVNYEPKNLCANLCVPGHVEYCFFAPIEGSLCVIRRVNRHFKDDWKQWIKEVRRVHGSLSDILTRGERLVTRNACGPAEALLDLKELVTVSTTLKEIKARE